MGVADLYEFDPAKVFAYARPANEIRKLSVNQPQRRDNESLGRQERLLEHDFEFVATVESFAHGPENPRSNAHGRIGIIGGSKQHFLKPRRTAATRRIVCGETPVGRFEVRLKRRQDVSRKQTAQIGVDKL